MKTANGYTNETLPTRLCIAKDIVNHSKVVNRDDLTQEDMRDLNEAWRRIYQVYVRHAGDDNMDGMTEAIDYR